MAASVPLAEANGKEVFYYVKRQLLYGTLSFCIIIFFTNCIGKNLTNEEKKNHLVDINREYLIDKICIQEVIPPDD